MHQLKLKEKHIKYFLKKSGQKNNFKLDPLTQLNKELYEVKKKERVTKAKEKQKISKTKKKKQSK